MKTLILTDQLYDTVIKFIEEQAHQESSDIYEQNGFKDRQDYLDEVAEAYDVDPVHVKTISDMMGPVDDFDGLISYLDEYCKL